ncbi:MAG: sugar transferase [Pirellulaceae bacterium]
MITKPNRRTDSPFRRLGSLFRGAPQNLPIADVLSESAFDLLLRKEMSRCLRRPRFLEFCVIQTSIGADQLKEPNVIRFVSDLKERCRITDEFGNWNAQLSLLLPETDLDGAKNVANHALESARKCELKIETEIFRFPTDDSIMHVSNEDQSQCNPTSSDQNSDSSPSSNASIASGNVKVDFRIDRGHVNENHAPATCLKSSPTPLWKRAMDIGVASVGMLGFVPLYLLIAAAIKLESRGPVMFSQWREGKDGKRFRIYKFRTMQQDAEARKAELRANSEQDGPAFKMSHDPRITRVGYYLRKSCLDEIPQIINVLRGEMSLVGPRPLPVDESQNCRMWHRQRLSVLPGLTCIWQVLGGRNVSFEEWMRMDLEYIRKRSLFLDLNLLAKTFFKVVRHKGSV